MTLEQTVASHLDLPLIHSHVTRDYKTLRDRTVREYGAGLAQEADRAVALVLDVVMRKISRQIDRDDAVKAFANNGWRNVPGMLPDLFVRYHELARIASYESISGLSEFERAVFLQSLDRKYFGQSSARTMTLINPNFPGAMLAISNLGHEPQPDYAFGLKAILPQCADYLLWWAVRSARLWTYFSEPVDFGENAWEVRSAPAQSQGERPFAKAALGIRNKRLVPAISEERFFVAPFSVPDDIEHLSIRAGTYLAYHRL